jgi:predicted Zn-dependent protease
MTTKTRLLERESKAVIQEQNSIQTNPLTPERTEELKKRVEQLPRTSRPSNGENLLAFLLRKMDSLNEWMGGSPMSQRDRARRNAFEQGAGTDIRRRFM